MLGLTPAYAAEPTEKSAPRQAAATKSEPAAQPLTLQVQGMEQHVTLVAPPKPQVANAIVAPRKRPAVVMLHPGFLGDDSTSRGIARELAKRDIVVIMPSYRGEKRGLDGKKSDGRIEFCSGEVDDAQKAIEWLMTQPDIDPLRIGLIGMSHGGCIALRTALREPRLRAVATFSAPVAIEQVVEHLGEKPFGFFLYNGILEHQLERYIQGTPKSAPENYAVRSPLFLANKLNMPLFVLHGGSDHIVPTTQACWLGQVLKQSGRAISERWLGKDGKLVEHHAPRCALEKTAAAVNDNAPRTELWLVEGQDHIFFSGAAKRAAQARAVDFLVEELTR